jgi:DNA-binding transcriptional regulator/RsmH inhibitor MraZ
MKDPARHVSRHLRRVRRGQQAFSRQVLHTARRIREDPEFRKLMTELLRHLAELVARAVILSAVNRCLRAGLSAREHAQVIPIRPKPIVVP